jgi:oligopeptide transport system substrate-binding protein
MVQEIIDSNANLLPAYSNFVLQNVRELSSQYYGFLTIDPLMKDVHIRRAFNYAIDRNKLVKYTLKNEGTANHYGIVPMGLPGYDHSQLKGYSFRPSSCTKRTRIGGLCGG